MSELDDVLNNAKGWYPQMPAPASFSPKQRLDYQKRIDGIVGTRNGLSIIKLAWAPEELRWWPHRLGTDPIGYNLPIFYYGNDSEGNKVAAPRWVLLELCLPEQYGSTWEAARYLNYDGSVWDIKGPLPSYRYLELKAHSHHDGECCKCHGSDCVCNVHCWGKYLEPNERLLDWIRQVAWAARQDKDVDPTKDAQSFSAPEAQRENVTRQKAVREESRRRKQEAWDDLEDHLIRQPSSIGKYDSASGLYLLE